jgi:tRNA-2-methylthio-N6-dimethylallyladenosine synthase
MAGYGEKIAPYFHLPLQSGSDSILRAMNRTYSAEKFLSIVRKLREKIPNISLSTDVIVGFPGETDADYRDTLRVLSECEFDMVYAFVYSKREGTRAATLLGQIDDSTKSARITELLSMQDTISRRKNSEYVDTVQHVLTDSVEERGGETVYTGRTYGNRLVHFTARSSSVGEFINVRITKAAAYDLIGEATE